MKTVSFIFDRRLYDILQKEGRTQFTTRELRDAYAKHLEGTDFRLGDVRRYVYEQIRRLLRAGWLVPDKERRKRGQVYHLQPIPPHLHLELIDNGFENSLKPAPKEELTSSTPEPSATPPASSSDAQTYLEGLLKEVQLDFLSSMGETERYKQLLDDMPHLKDQVESEYRGAKDRSSRLLGHLRAVENTLKAVASQR
ncbi:hypothetical protein EBB56_05295 [Halomonas sp. YLB-10]|uniref:hypothetical protein n=1 Tax=Halomonas sp. YLB-10 TaxID=2483111 RepID=UPI000F602A26|nr:hypothetical protein [Halomonas sp. YLB-10]RQW71836.1 hypothetical protein EBB56_05295 [Halomonas sp. YLB-10]